MIYVTFSRSRCLPLSIFIHALNVSLMNIPQLLPADSQVSIHQTSNTHSVDSLDSFFFPTLSLLLISFTLTI
jgi:hypothetical protein